MSKAAIVTAILVIQLLLGLFVIGFKLWVVQIEIFQFLLTGIGIAVGHFMEGD